MPPVKLSPKSPLSHPLRSSLQQRSFSSENSSSRPSKNGTRSGESPEVNLKDAMSETAATLRNAIYEDNQSEHSRSSGTTVLPNSLHMPSLLHKNPNGGGLQEADPIENAGEMPRNMSKAEVERLRGAMNAQIQLNQHRERLARQLGEKDDRKTLGPPTAAGNATAAAASSRVRVSTISEEIGPLSRSLEDPFSSSFSTGLGFAATESNTAVHGGTSATNVVVCTPSYPFPSMRTPGPSRFGAVHNPFTTLSPTINTASYASGLFSSSGSQDLPLSGSVTPASTLRFQPLGNEDVGPNHNYKTPNLYEMSLALSSEPGLEPWWSSVVQMMSAFYGAHRVTLSVPADSTDIENVPWGQKATFNIVKDDELSLTYLPRGSSMVPSSASTNETSNSEDPKMTDEYFSTESQILNSNRPGLSSRHSFTAYENTKRASTFMSETSRASPTCRRPLIRAKSYLSTHPDPPPRTVTLQNAQLHSISLEDHLALEAANEPESWDVLESPREVTGRVFSVLQALDFEADPLIDNKGVSRVLQRGRVIALTRDYPYIGNTATDENSGSSKSLHNLRINELGAGEKSKSRFPDVGSRISSLFGSRTRKPSTRSRIQATEQGRNGNKDAEAVDGKLSFQEQKYEEYEQAPASPWSQSPAPSPAVQTETSENPFFANATSVDEETFNPQTTPDYTEVPAPETIGADRSCTVLHIPLIHPLLSKPVQSSRLDAAAMESRSSGRCRACGPASKDVDNGRPSSQERKIKNTPIAILSILTPLIPYPSNLRQSLNHLAPHLATSFSLCRHYSNLETEIAGLTRRRPSTTGFGAVASEIRPTLSGDSEQPGDASYSLVGGAAHQRSTGGSITSPSEYSVVSRSNPGSPAGTPGWDPGSVGLLQDKRLGGGSPSLVIGEGYFSSRARAGSGRVDTGSASSITTARKTAKEKSSSDLRTHRQLRGTDDRPVDADVSALQNESFEDLMPLDFNIAPIQELSLQHCAGEASTDVSTIRDSSPSRNIDAGSTRRHVLRASSNQGPSKLDRQNAPHFLLHSYGADFGATFQSLPTTTASRNPTGTRTHARSGSTSELPKGYMPPPSDRVKGILLDSLPLHLFVALPATGEILWVNSRYLTYRGQSVENLYENPWESIHPKDRDEYLKSWRHALRTGEQFAMQARLKRFDGTYRWFYTRASGLRDSRGVVVQWHGSSMDIHEQHVAEVKAARQEEIEASEAKHRQLANLIPQIIFSATDEDGVTFANQQWLSYTGQAFSDSLGLGFMDFVHPDDLAKCQIFDKEPNTSLHLRSKKQFDSSPHSLYESLGGKSSNKSSNSATFTAPSETPTDTTIKGFHQSLSRSNSSSNTSVFEYPSADIAELMRSGVIKVEKDGNGQASYSTEVRLRSKSGEYRWHLVRFVEVDNISLGSGDGSWFGACADINDHKLLEMKLKEAMESKSKFLSNMSHEIRTPLIGISGMISFLQDTVLNEEQMDYCNTISSSAQGLLAIINDILDLAKADAGMMKLVYDWFHVRSLVEEVNETLSTMAITKHLEVNYVVDVDVPEMVKGDRFRIRQALLNVIGNAIKFTTVGEVFTRCGILPSTEADNIRKNEVVLEFSIIDTGKGFTQEEAEIIFKPFSQIDASSTRTQGGTGLGLVISRQLIELHGGKMEGMAVPGEGSTFTFTAVFGLPTADDFPEYAGTPALSSVPSLGRSSVRSSISNDKASRATRQPDADAIMERKLSHSPVETSPKTNPVIESPVVTSSSSSAVSPGNSLRLMGTHHLYISSATHSPSNFAEAGLASGTNQFDMKIALPDRNFMPKVGNMPPEDRCQGTTLKSKSLAQPSQTLTLAAEVPNDFLPSMYSILLICPQKHSREATTQHIEMTVPKDIPHQITALSSSEEAHEIIGAEECINFTHIVLSLGDSGDVVNLIDKTLAMSHPRTEIVVLSDPLQRQEVIKMASHHNFNQLAKAQRVTFIYKPVKPSRFAVIFDPDRERDLSTDRNRFSAQQQVATQRQNYVDIEKRLGNRGLRVLLVEDNATNQKVLLKFLSKIGIAVDLALDGLECTNKVFGNSQSFYSLILCDLHMPNKDGYQACREIREWEKRNNHKPMPIIALSANVMADVLDKCNEAGFSNYVTKPVDFKALSTVMGDLLDPEGSPTNL